MKELLSMLSLIFFGLGVIQIPIMIFFKPDTTNYWGSIQSGVGGIDSSAQTLFIMLLLSFLSGLVREIVLIIQKSKKIDVGKDTN